MEVRFYDSPAGFAENADSFLCRASMINVMPLAVIRWLPAAAHPERIMALVLADNQPLLAAINTSPLPALRSDGETRAVSVPVDGLASKGHAISGVSGPTGMAGPFAAAYRESPPEGGRINLVYTPPEHRRCGYASACVGALTQRLLTKGWEWCAVFVHNADPTAAGARSGTAHPATWM